MPYSLLAHSAAYYLITLSVVCSIALIHKFESHFNFMYNGPPERARTWVQNVTGSISNHGLSARVGRERTESVHAF